MNPISIEWEGVKLRRERFGGTNVYVWYLKMPNQPEEMFAELEDATDAIRESGGEEREAFFIWETAYQMKLDTQGGVGGEEIGVQNAPIRYKKSSGGRECIDQIRDSMSDSGFIEFCRGNVMKYRHRGDAEKPGSLGKADWYAQMIKHVQNPAIHHDPRNERADYVKYVRATPPGLRGAGAGQVVEFSSDTRRDLTPGTARVLIKEHGATFEGFAWTENSIVGPVYGPPDEVHRILQEEVKALYMKGDL